MAIPDYQSLFIPILKLASDGNEHNISETIETLAEQLGLNEADRAELLPSGRQRKFVNRVSWARTYLQKALLISYPASGRFRITERGMEVLKENPSQINVKYLRQFPEFEPFLTHKDRVSKV